MRLVAVLILTIVTVGCQRRPSAAPAGQPTIASTVPSVTDLIVGMGAADRLVAVSTYDAGRPDVGRLPKAGNYQTIDWEQLAAVRPTVLVTATALDRLPAGFANRSAALHITPLNVQINQLGDLYPAIAALGAALHEPTLAAAAEQQVHERLDRVSRSVAGQSPTSAIVSLSPDGTYLAGPGNYLDEVLTLAGGTNAAAKLGRPWPTVDREALLSLRPAAVIQLVTGGPQEAAEARATWAAMPMSPRPRVCIIAGPYVEQPGWHLPELAERIASCLHPSSTTKPS